MTLNRPAVEAVGWFNLTCRLLLGVDSDCTHKKTPTCPKEGGKAGGWWRQGGDEARFQYHLRACMAGGCIKVEKKLG